MARAGRWAAVAAGTGAAAAAAAAAAAVLARRRGPGGVPARTGGTTMPTRVTARHVHVARLAGRVGGRAAVNRARRVFAAHDRRAELDAELQLHTAEEVARTLGQMKGALMKLGQLASFVDDGMPEPVRQALGQLQQDAPPMAPELAAAVVEEQLGAPPDRAFAEWDPVPIAAASIGQVHRAITHDGRAVAVKVQYPGVADAIESDLANIDLAAMAMPLMWKSLDSKAVVEELRARLIEELDYRLEADNQRLFADLYRGHPFIHVPEVVDELSTNRVLTTELAEGARFAELETWDQRERDLAAEAIYRFVFRSFYRFHVFNGDPHPGNYLFRPGGRVTFLDFGLVKRFGPEDIDNAIEIARAAVIEHDPAAIRRATEKVGYWKRGAPVSDERLSEYSMMFWEPVVRDEPTTITAEWATDLVRRYMFGREFADILDYAMVPQQYVILQRINIGLMAILGRLNATANWRAIAEEIWPNIDRPATTAMGEEEARWLAGRVR